MRKFDSINVIPFIDIMLVLLAIVLTTATFVNNGQLDIKLPKASSDSDTLDVEKIEIAIDSQEALFFDGQPTTLDQLTDSLTTLGSETAIILRIDETVPFNRFISVIDLLKKLELDRVSVLTRKAVSSGVSLTTPSTEPSSESTLGQ